MCDIRKVALFSVVAGAVVTALTAGVVNIGVIGEFPDVRFISIPLLGVSYWGSPLPWVKQVVYPGAPKQLIWPNMLADIVFWTVVVAVAKLLWVKVLAKPGKPKRAKAKRKPRRRRR